MLRLEQITVDVFNIKRGEEIVGYVHRGHDGFWNAWLDQCPLPPRHDCWTAEDALAYILRLCVAMKPHQPC